MITLPWTKRGRALRLARKRAHKREKLAQVRAEARARAAAESSARRAAVREREAALKERDRAITAERKREAEEARRLEREEARRLREEDRARKAAKREADRQARTRELLAREAAARPRVPEPAGVAVMSAPGQSTSSPTSSPAESGEPAEQGVRLGSICPDCGHPVGSPAYNNAHARSAESRERAQAILRARGDHAEECPCCGGLHGVQLGPGEHCSWCNRHRRGQPGTQAGARQGAQRPRRGKTAPAPRHPASRPPARPAEPSSPAGSCGQATEDGTPCRRRGTCPPGTHHARRRA